MYTPLNIAVYTAAFVGIMFVAADLGAGIGNECAIAASIL